MTPISIFIFGLVVGGAVVLFLYTLREAKKHRTGVVEETIGICSAALERTSQKEARKEKALALVRERDSSTGSGYKELGNAEIREALGVSRRSAANYMEELEKEGKIEQVGDIGRSVIYRLKQRT